MTTPPPPPLPGETPGNTPPNTPSPQTHSCGCGDGHAGCCSRPAGKKFFERHPIFQSVVRVAAMTVTFFTSTALSIILFFVIFAGFFGLVFLLAGDDTELAEIGFTYSEGDELSENIILEIDVNGIILSEDSDPFSEFLLGGQVTYGQEVKEILDYAAQNDNVKGVILEMNTPGGLVTGSKQIADGVDRFKESGKPIVAYVNGLSASGGMWAMANTDTVLAEEGSTIGSIGVIAGEFLFYDEPILIDGVATNNPIQHQLVTAGEGKDGGNPFRQWTDKEIEKTQQDANDIYDVFVDYVAQSRQLDANTIRNDIGAYVYSNKRAIELGLIDTTGSIEDSRAATLDAAGISDTDYQIMEQLPTFFFGGPFIQSMLSTTYKNSDLTAFCAGDRPRSVVLYGTATSFCGK